MVTTVFVVFLCGTQLDYFGTPVPFCTDANGGYSFRTAEACLNRRDQQRAEGARHNWPPTGWSFQCATKPVSTWTAVTR